MSNRYDHDYVELKWQKKWEEAHCFEAKDDYTMPKFYPLIEFPYPSGAGLHVGHPRSNTAMDIIARKRRMEGYEDRFIENMEDDLNTADALSALFDFAKDINTNLTAETAPSRELCGFALNLFTELAGVLGLLYAKNTAAPDGEIEKLIAARAEARKAKNWAEADRIRDELKARNVVLEDTPQGVKWKIVK